MFYFAAFLFFASLFVSLLYAGGIVKLILGSASGFIILSPENTTYYFNQTEVNYTLGLNISSNMEPVNYSYSLYDLRHNNWVYSNVSFSPNITFNAVRWSNRLDIVARDSSNKAYRDSVVFFVSVNNSAPNILNMSREFYICENNFLSLIFNASDVDEEIYSFSLNPQYPSSPFYISSLGVFNFTIFNYEIFSGVLTKNDAGGINNGYRRYPESISVSDSEYSDSRDINITVIEVNNAPVIDNIGVHTIWNKGKNTSFDYQVLVNDIENGNQSSQNLTFSLIFNESQIKLFNISSNGTINFTANSSTPLGVYYINVSVKDKGLLNPHENIGLCGQNGSSIISNKQFSLTVTDKNRPPEIIWHDPSNLNLSGSGDDIFHFNITFEDPDGTIPDAYWYVDDSIAFYYSGSLASEFYYNFGCGDSRNHIIKVRITDGELTDSLEWNINVSTVPCPPGAVVGGSGGGGGGVPKKVDCSEKWGCKEWQDCGNLKESFESRKIDLVTMTQIKDRCAMFNWTDEFCGFQTRNCEDINKCKSSRSSPGIVRECFFTKNPSCFDNIKNCHNGSCELLVDCGGSCLQCPTCSDGIQNQEEEKIDCGGPCSLCKELPLPPEPKKPNKFLIFISILLFVVMLFLIIRLILRYYNLLGKSGIIPLLGRRNKCYYKDCPEKDVYEYRGVNGNEIFKYNNFSGTRVVSCEKHKPNGWIKSK